MTFLCCENCIVEMICTTPCEKFEVNKLQLDDLLSFNNCLRLIKHYEGAIFKIKNIISINISSYAILFYKKGKLHRDDGPAVIDADGQKEWWVDGKRHRNDGPAIIYADGTKEWRKNSNLHRDDGPAVIRADGGEEWWVNGNIHRNDGPAIIRADGSEEWWVNGVKIK